MPSVANSSYYRTGDQYNSYIHYTCDVGHWFQENMYNETVLCLPDKQWQQPIRDGCEGKFDWPVFMAFACKFIEYIHYKLHEILPYF